MESVTQAKNYDPFKTSVAPCSYNNRRNNISQSIIEIAGDSIDKASTLRCLIEGKDGWNKSGDWRNSKNLIDGGVGK